jgi:hypothetical protein
VVRVFLSYSHDDDVHKGRVHALADRLRSDPDLKIVLDRDTGPGGPDEGWPAWSERQVRDSDRVLIACSRQYALRYEGKGDNSDRGRGTVIEARAIQQFLYDAKGRNARFRVVVFDPADADHIPHQLRGYHYFKLDDDSSYDDMVAWLKASARAAEAPAPEGLLWPKPDLEYKLALADRGPHFDAVRAALSGQSSNRIFLFKGDGASGKTQFLNELSSYAEHMGVPWTLFDFKGARSHEHFFEKLLLDLPDHLLPHTRAAKSTPLLDFVNDLKGLKTPVLLLFDTFEKASEESCSWLETLLLPCVGSLLALVVVIGGRHVPDHTQHRRWRALAEHRVLEPIKNAEDWLDYVARVYNGSLELRDIQTLAVATDGSPGNLRPLLEKFVNETRAKQAGTD